MSAKSRGMADMSGDRGWTKRKNDNITATLLVLHVNRDYALTGAAIRRLVYAVTGRLAKDTKSGWTTGFRAQVGKLWTADGQVRIGSGKTYALTEAGRVRLHEDALARGLALDNFEIMAHVDPETAVRYDRREIEKRAAEKGRAAETLQRHGDRIRALSQAAVEKWMAT